MTTYPLPIDCDLSRLPASSLCISQKTSASFALDESTEGQELQEIAEKQRKRKQQQQGVPGFPDFPSFWAGEEGWVVWKRNGTTSKQSPKLDRRQKNRFRREAVNVAAITSKRRARRNTVTVKARKGRKKPHDWKIRSPKIKHSRQMEALSCSLGSLSCK